MVTDDHIGCNGVCRSVFLTNVSGLSWLNFHPSLRTFTSFDHANIRSSITFPPRANRVLQDHAKLPRNTQILLIRKSTKYQQTVCVNAHQAHMLPQSTLCQRMAGKRIMGGHRAHCAKRLLERDLWETTGLSTCPLRKTHIKFHES